MLTFEFVIYIKVGESINILIFCKFNMILGPLSALSIWKRKLSRHLRMCNLSMHEDRVLTIRSQTDLDNFLLNTRGSGEM